LAFNQAGEDRGVGHVAGVADNRADGPDQAFSTRAVYHGGFVSWRLCGTDAFKAQETGLP